MFMSEQSGWKQQTVNFAKSTHIKALSSFYHVLSFALPEIPQGRFVINFCIFAEYDKMGYIQLLQFLWQ